MMVPKGSQRMLIRLALVAFLVAGCASAAAVTPSPEPYTGHGEHILTVDYPVGPYRLDWSAEGVWPDGRRDGCRLEVTAEGADARVVMLSEAVGSGASRSGSATADLPGPTTVLTIDGTGCTWSVTIAPA